MGQEFDYVVAYSKSGLQVRTTLTLTSTASQRRKDCRALGQQGSHARQKDLTNLGKF